MQKQVQEVDSKIPFLGDIPGLGVLFKHKTRNDVRTELLIFLTPYIVAHPSELAALATHEQDSMQFPASSQKELHRFLNSLPTKDEKKK